MTAIAHLQKAREWLALKVERDVHPNYDTLLEYVTHLEQQVERLQQANAGLAELLNVAVCPNKSIGCDGMQYPDYDNRGEVIGVQCQWCDEKNAAIEGQPHDT